MCQHLQTGYTHKRKDDIHHLMIPQTREVEARSGYLQGLSVLCFKGIPFPPLPASLQHRAHDARPSQNQILNKKKAYEQPLREKRNRTHSQTRADKSPLFQSSTIPRFPKGWSNEPENHGFDEFFNESEEQDISVDLKTEHTMPHPIPSHLKLWFQRRTLLLIDSGDGKYYVWEPVSEWFVRAF